MRYQEAQLPSSSSGMSPGVGELDPSYLPPAVNQCYQAFPLTPPNVHLGSMQETMEAYLPAVERASALCVTFLDNAGWMLGILSREDIIGGLIPLVYKQAPGSYGPHELAMLFAILAIGCLADLSRPPYDIEAQHYYRIGRATLALQPVLREHSLTTVKVRIPSQFPWYLSFIALPGSAPHECLQWHEREGGPFGGVLRAS